MKLSFPLINAHKEAILNCYSLLSFPILKVICATLFFTGLAVLKCVQAYLGCSKGLEKLLLLSNGRAAEILWRGMHHQHPQLSRSGCSCSAAFWAQRAEAIHEGDAGSLFLLGNIQCHHIVMCACSLLYWYNCITIILKLCRWALRFLLKVVSCMPNCFCCTALCSASYVLMLSCSVVERDFLALYMGTKIRKKSLEHRVW